MHIINSRIYINGKKLDTFYGSESSAMGGYKAVEKVKNRATRLGENEYFLLGDVWWRSFYSSLVEGPFSGEAIKSKVVGTMN
ncbi:hypothetical protein [Paenibacillus sp. NPDC058071]|uniref:hypothetical protein n=1 Tax=Paenibacillus sp. NPDC058071 TaxID=3346326 RepID=UPI0036D8D03C